MIGYIAYVYIFIVGLLLVWFHKMNKTQIYTHFDLEFTWIE